MSTMLSGNRKIQPGVNVMYRNFNYLTAIVMLASLCAPFALDAAPKPMKADKAKVNQWNEFADALFDVHKKLTENKKIRTTEEYGGYYQMPKFYQETNYYDAENGRLLSRIQRETASPETIHHIEVFIYDDKGELVRDYLAAYLPVYRNAPIYTFINFHHKQDGLHGFRQFDASGNRIYEQCKKPADNDAILLSLEGIDITPGPYSRSDTLQSELYAKCFAGLPLDAGKYLRPRVEIGQQSQDAEAATAPTAEEVHRQVAAYSASIKSEPRNARLYLKRGNAYLQLLEFELAAEDFSSAIKLDDALDEAWFGRGMALGRSGHIDAGIADLDVVIKRQPNNSRAYTKRGVRYLWKGDEANAERDLKQALILDANNAEAHDDLGVIHARRGEYDIAIAHFKSTIRLDPGYQKGFHNLAMAYYLTKRHPLALEYIDQALALQSEARNSILLKAEILLALGKKAEAKTVRDEAEFLPEGEWSEQLTVN